MTVLTSSVSTASQELQANRQAYQAILDDLHERRRAARRGGREKSHQRNLDKGKMLPRNRVEALLDPGSPFLEIGDLLSVQR